MQLEQIKGLGPKTINILRRLGINDYNDLISYYPFRYEVIKKTDLNNALDGDKVVVDGVIEVSATINYLRNHKDKMNFKLNTGNKLINVTIFNRGFLKSKLIINNFLSPQTAHFSTLYEFLKNSTTYHFL